MMRLMTLLLAMAFFASGCTKAEEALDCRSVCNRYKECFDSDYDVDACVSSCRDQDDVNDAAECEACIDDLSCTESFACVPECAGIVP